MNSKIATAPPHVRELFELLIREANHEPAKYRGWEIQKGQLFRPYSELREKLHWNEGWQKKMYTPDQIKKGMKYLRDNGMITTKRAPGGVLITICKYDYYQTIGNYKSTNESTKDGINSSTFNAPIKHDSGTIINNNNIPYNNKNVNNLKKKYLSDLDEIENLNKDEKFAYRFWKIISGNLNELKIKLNSIEKATCKDWADPIKQLLTVYNKTEAEINEVIEFFPKIDFWKRTLRHTKQLIKKNENDLLFFDSILIQKREADAQNSLLTMEELENALKVFFPNPTNHFVKLFYDYQNMCKDTGIKILIGKTLDLEITNLAYLSKYDILAAVNILRKAIIGNRTIPNRHDKRYPSD